MVNKTASESIWMPGRPAVALRTVLKTDRRHVVDVSPEAVYRGDSVDTLAAVRAVRTADLVVDEFACVRGARRGTVDEQSKVDRLVRRDGVVEETVVEAVLVARARLAEVGQLIELVRPTQAGARRHSVRRRVGGTKIIADRALDPDVGDRKSRHPSLPSVKT